MMYSRSSCASRCRSGSDSCLTSSGPSIRSSSRLRGFFLPEAFFVIDSSPSALAQVYEVRQLLQGERIAVQVIARAQDGRACPAVRAPRQLTRLVQPEHAHVGVLPEPLV